MLRAAVSTSSQVSPTPFLTVALQFVISLPGPVLGVVACRTCKQTNIELNAVDDVCEIGLS